ncbi:heterokaryon incompatibility protein-domain-containing protein [Cadophora sp. MPI-SDFR-AT-0126]|nr:heterokaryon incompatibility protein-domain-containing protein [Leotiomycetes sp. MPI-SDFR-AT-0126]
MTSTHQDKLLHEPLHTIRLLQLPQGTSTSTFDGNLIPFVLARSPPFIALSYTWGATLHPEPLTINGHSLHVSSNLHSFLSLISTMKDFPPDTWWWIDSICINQDDEREKSSQMEIMGRIYKTAYRTVVWLGEEVDSLHIFEQEARDCRGAIKNLYRLCDEKKHVDGKSKVESRAAMAWLREPKSGVDWRALRCLFLRPWWKRVWTLQEFLISDRMRLTFYCGTEGISRHDLEAAVYASWLCKGWDKELLGRKGHEAGWNRRRMSQWYFERPHGMGLVAMLAYVGDSGVTKPEDRIYSLLGIAKDAHLVPPFNSKSSVEDTYTNLVKAFIQPENYNSLDIICYSHLFNDDARKSDSEKILPSWVPDWRAHVEGKVIPVMASQGSSEGTGNFRPTGVHGSDVAYRASGSTKPVFNIDSSNKNLTCTGIVIDIIDGLGGSGYDDAGELIESLPLQQSICEFNAATTTTTTTPLSITEIVSRCIALDRKDRYLSESMPADFFHDSFLQFCLAYFQRPTSAKVPAFFRSWFSLNKSLLIHGRSLEEHCQEMVKDMSTPEAKKFREGKLKEFYGRLEDTIVTMARRLVVCEKGNLGMAACRARKGDLVVVLLGCSVPLVLRREGKAFELVGECYLDGFMNGEALEEEKKLAKQELRIV